MVRAHRIDIGGLLTGSRQVMQVEDEVPIDPFEGIVFERPAQVRLQLRAVDGWLEVQGEVEVRAVGDCAACLTPVDFEVRADIDERLDLSGDRDRDPFGEDNVFVGGRIDVADLAQQVVLSALPMGVRCSPQCNGLCEACGAKRDAGRCARCSST